MRKKEDESKRPWGEYKVISKTKILFIKPNKKISLQYHNNRDEFWRILKGSGVILIDKKKFNAKIGDFFSIPRGKNHRIIAGSKGIEILEIASGDVSEDDIVRIEDDFGRIN